LSKTKLGGLVLGAVDDTGLQRLNTWS